jgi:hypothetical protein
MRDRIVSDLLQINSMFRFLDKKDLFIYCLSMKDESIVKLTAKYIFNVTVIYNDCT